MQSFLQPPCNATMLDTGIPASYIISCEPRTLQLPDDLNGGRRALIYLLPSCTRPAIYLGEASSRTQLREGRMGKTPYTCPQTSRKRYNSTFMPRRARSVPTRYCTHRGDVLLKAKGQGPQDPAASSAKLSDLERFEVCRTLPLSDDWPLQNETAFTAR